MRAIAKTREGRLGGFALNQRKAHTKIDQKPLDDLFIANDPRKICPSLWWLRLC